MRRILLDARKAYACLTGLAMLVCASVHAADEPVRIGWVGWSDTEITTKLAERALNDHLGKPVKLVQADIGIHFQALANGNIDLIPMVWLPNTHKAFWDKYKDSLEDLGVLYEGKIGWAVPASVPQSQLKTIEDLNRPEVREQLGGTILTSEAGNGQYKLSLKAIEAYQLTGYKLVASSETGMLKEFERNLGRKRWSVINAWNPHWMFSRWQLRYLEDPKGIFGGPEQIHAIARKGFSAEQPAVAAFFAHYTLPLADLEELMMQARQRPADEVVASYYAANKARFDAMFTTAKTADSQP